MTSEFKTAAKDLYSLLRPYDDVEKRDENLLRITELFLESAFWRGYNAGVDKWLEHLRRDAS